jgi:hypothetical protein
MKTKILIIPMAIGALAGLTGCVTPPTPHVSNHDIKIKHSHSQGNGLSWYVDRYREKVKPSGDTLSWRMDGNAAHPAPPFWIVVRTNEVKWTEPGGTLFESVTNAPFGDGTYGSMASQTDGYDQVLSLNIQALTSTPDKTVPVRYYLVAKELDFPVRNSGGGASPDGTVRSYAIPYYFYMADAMVVWE